MKLSFSTLGCPDWSFEQIVENAHRMGYSAVELRGVGSQLRTEKLACMLPENHDATRSLLDKNGVSLCGVGTSVRFHDAVEYWDALQEGRRALELCTELKIPFIRVFGDAFPDGEAHENVVRRVTEGLASLCAYAASLCPAAPVQVLLEVHGDFNTLPLLRQICDALQYAPGFGLIWDVENSYLWHGENFVPFYKALRSRIRHVHIKDCVLKNAKPHPCLPGTGVLPLKAMIAQMLADGYDGYFSFEWEKRWHPDILPPEQALVQYVGFMRALEAENQ